jgi:hypothetical protein
VDAHTSLRRTQATDPLGRSGSRTSSHRSFESMIGIVIGPEYQVPVVPIWWPSG